MLNTNGISVPIVHYGDVVTLPPGDERYVARILGLAMNNARQVALTSYLAGGSVATIATLMFDESEGLRVILAEPVKIPGYSATRLDTTITPIINRGGHIAICLQGFNLLPSTIFYRGANSRWKVVAAIGQKIEQVDANTEFVSSATATEPVKNAFRKMNRGSTFSNVILNARNQIAFVAKMVGAEAHKTNVGICVADAETNRMRLIARTGDAMEVEKGVWKEIADVKLMGGTGNEDGRPSGMNERGEIVYAARFKDGSAAIVVDRTVASNALVDSATSTVDAKVAAEEIETLFAKWNEQADEYLVELRRRLEESDYVKLSTIADELRSEYNVVLKQLGQELENLGDEDAVTRFQRIDRLRRHVVQLSMVWKQLQVWPFQKLEKRSTTLDRDFTKETLKIFSSAQQYPEIRDRIRSKMKQLEEMRIPSLEFVALPESRNLAMEMLFHPYQVGGTLKQFAESIGPPFENLLPIEPKLPFDQEHALENGPLTALRREIRNLIRLRIDKDGVLCLDQSHWTLGTPRISLALAKQLTAELLDEHALSKEILYSMRERQQPMQARRRFLRTPESPVAERFNELRVAAIQLKNRQSTSFASSGRVDSISKRFKTDLVRASIEQANKTFALSISELTGFEQSLDIAASNVDSMLTIQLTASNVSCALTQNRDDTVRWVSDIDEEDARSAPTFADLYRADPHFVEVEIIGRLRAFGIAGPATLRDPIVPELIVAELQGQSRRISEAAWALIAELDSDDFASRRRASRDLSQRLYVYYETLHHAHDSADISLEAKTRIERLLRFDKEQYGEYRYLIEHLQVVDSPRWLVQIMKGLEDADRSIIAERLKMLTGQSFGNDQMAWHDWLEKSN